MARSRPQAVAPQEAVPLPARPIPRKFDVVDVIDIAQAKQRLDYARLRALVCPESLEKGDRLFAEFIIAVRSRDKLIGQIAFWNICVYASHFIKERGFFGSLCPLYLPWAYAIEEFLVGTYQKQFAPLSWDQDEAEFVKKLRRESSYARYASFDMKLLTAIEANLVTVRMSNEKFEGMMRELGAWLRTVEAEGHFFDEAGFFFRGRLVLTDDPRLCADAEPNPALIGENEDPDFVDPEQAERFVRWFLRDGSLREVGDRMRVSHTTVKRIRNRILSQRRADVIIASREMGNLWQHLYDKICEAVEESRLQATLQGGVPPLKKLRLAKSFRINKRSA